MTTDCRTHKVVVKGKVAAADPLKVVDRVQKKSGRKVELLTPIPPKPEKKEEKKEEEKEKPKPEEKEDVSNSFSSVLASIQCLPVFWFPFPSNPFMGLSVTDTVFSCCSLRS